MNKCSLKLVSGRSKQLPEEYSRISSTQNHQCQPQVSSLYTSRGRGAGDRETNLSWNAWKVFPKCAGYKQIVIGSITPPENKGSWILFWLKLTRCID